MNTVMDCGYMCKLRAMMISLILILYLSVVDANPEAKRLYNDLLVKSGYNKLIRPVANNTEILTVKLGLRLSQLIGIDEKNQIMTTNVWLFQEWIDFNLKWIPEEYGGVNHLYVPAEDLWKPDIVLYNNADGNYQVTLMTKATLHYTGRVVWEPPAIYKSSCTIDVEFFPFDEQTCGMKFGSWTYDGFQVDLKHKDQADVSGEVDIPMAMDMSGYYRSFIWDVLSVPARRNEVYYPCCPESYPDVTFTITIRRKTLFYTVNLIIPCVAISFLTVLVFYLPSDSGEKITLCISILLALTVFFLLLSDLIPPTSLVVPLIGKYLLFTMILVTLSVIITVIVLNIHNRSPTTHTMSPWLRRMCLHILPRLLLMKRPMIPAAEEEKKMKKAHKNRADNGTSGHKGPSVGTVYANFPENGSSMTDGSRLLPQSDTAAPNSERNNTIRSGMTDTLRSDVMSSLRSDYWSPKTQRKKATLKYPPEIEKALDAVKFIADHLRDEDKDEQIQEDWKYVAMVIDRLFLWIFTTACIVGTFGIILQAPTLYDDTQPMDVGIE